MTFPPPPAKRRPIVGGNWKMNTTIDSAIDLAAALVRQIGEVEAVDVVLFPPFPNLHAVHGVIDAGRLQLGAQDVYWETAGAYTGEVSVSMLASVGCRWVITGHSERRRLLGESSNVVNRKVRAALDGDLGVVVAIGETGEERHGGRMEAVLCEQLGISLTNVAAEEMSRVVIAYEPVWAIGTGETASPQQACDAHAYVRSVLEHLFGADVAKQTRIQYGGSVTAANAAELLAEPGIDGALVGGASLKADEFAAIVRAATA